MSAKTKGLPRNLWILFARNQDDGDLGMFFGDFLGQGQSRLPQHLDVAEGQLERIGRQLLMSLGDGGREDAPIVLAKCAVDRAKHLRLIVRYQDACKPR